MRAVGEVYDLREFLRCMTDEGSPCPSPDLAAKLEALLYAKAEGEGTLICPQMQPNDPLPAFYRIPDLPNPAHLQSDPSYYRREVVNNGMMRMRAWHKGTDVQSLSPSGWFF